MKISAFLHTHVRVYTQAYGAAGVVKVVRILERELMWGMRLLGVRKVSELTPDMVRQNASLKLYPSFQSF